MRQRGATPDGRLGEAPARVVEGQGVAALFEEARALHRRALERVLQHYHAMVAKHLLDVHRGVRRRAEVLVAHHASEPIAGLPSARGSMVASTFFPSSGSFAGTHASIPRQSASAESAQRWAKLGPG